jgi:uncharacterized protein (TIGR02996 family)
MTATIDSSTFDALIATVCDHPGDLVPMLVLADWMDENMGHDAGRAIRWAAERGKRPSLNPNIRAWSRTRRRLEDDKPSWLPWFLITTGSGELLNRADAWKWFVIVFRNAEAAGHV